VNVVAPGAVEPERGSLCRSLGETAAYVAGADALVEMSP
jgi:hypothetical protein